MQKNPVEMHVRDQLIASVSTSFPDLVTALQCTCSETMTGRQQVRQERHFPQVFLENVHILLPVCNAEILVVRKSF